ncbi:MAG: MFS transporter [Piscinibacter sp.]|nr:MFS transporter [Piscinibacter sp.]
MSPTAANRFPPPFGWLFAAEMVSLGGSLIGRTALPFVAILVLEAAPWQVALLGVADILAGALAAPLLGALVDRAPKRRTMIAADLLRALLLLAVPIAAWQGQLGIGLLLGVAFAVGVLHIAFELAYGALLPRLVPPQQLLAANSRLAAGRSVVEVGSFGIGGWLVQWLTAPLAVLADAFSYLGSALLILRARGVDDRAAPVPAGEAPAGLWREAREGFAVLWRDPVLRALALVEFCLAGAGQMFGAMLLLFLSREVGFAPGVLGMVFAVGGVSSFAGAVLAERLARRHAAGALMLAGLALVALGLLLPPLAPDAGLLGLALLVGQQVLGDGAHTLYDINDAVLRQTRAPREALARVHAGIRFVGLVAMLVGAGAAALIGELHGPRAALFGAAGWALLALLLAWAAGLHRVGTVPERAADPA